MSKVGRKPNVVPSTQWLLHIPVTLAAKVDLLLKDPVRDKVKYGSRGALLAGLLEQWITGQIKGLVQPEWKNNSTEAKVVYLVENAEDSPGRILGIFATELDATTFGLDQAEGTSISKHIVQYGHQNRLLDKLGC